MQIEQLYIRYLANPSIQTDSRKLKNGDLFFALKGPNFNGNVFAQQALEMGAAFSIIDEPSNFKSDKIILVEDVLTTLQNLARYHRQQLKIPFIAITGSNGKTTTKELVHQVLSTTFKTYTTEGNLNNHIGIPLTILKIKTDAEIAVIEMGANHKKEIEQYCTYTLPTHGLITNCGKAHLEGFGSIEGVLKGKGELFDYLRVNNGVAFIMNDYDYLKNMSHGLKTIFTYGTQNADVVGNVDNSIGLLSVKINKGTDSDCIKTHLVGEYNLPNVLASVAIGKYFKVPDIKIKDALENYIPSNSRSQLILKNSNTIILDAYNANPSSMKAAIENFAKMEGNKKVLLLGGMMELGAESISEHQSILIVIKKYKWNNVVLVGGDFYNLQHQFINFKNSLQAKDWFNAQGFNDTIILIKGSRSIQMEKVLE